MSTKHLAYALFAVAAVLAFIAVERYITNANNVEAMKQMGMGRMPGGGEVRAATPTVTLYCGLFAAIAAIGGVVLLLKRE